MNKPLEDRVIIVGGGAGGLMAAASLVGRNVNTLIIERNDRLGKKLLITGKGRCNITNSCDINEFFDSIPVNSSFLYSALYGYTNENLISDLALNGLDVKKERGGRVFPLSDKSSDVIKALCKMGADKCKVLLNKRVQKLIIENERVVGVVADGQKLSARSVIIATGGKSYPKTGSTGDGYILAKQAGHSITSIKGSLVPCEVNEKWGSSLMGLSLRNVSLTVKNSVGKTVYTDFGEMLFTHFGVSGPLVLSASSHINENGNYTFYIDLKPALNMEELYKRICRDMAEFSNKNFENGLSALLPKQIIPVIIDLSGIDKYKKCHQVTREERKTLASLIKELKLTFKKFRPIDEAIITSGGVNVKEINPSTMESKIIKGLYFCGEVMDVDAYTGGFNLQIAFSTGRLAGDNA